MKKQILVKKEYPAYTVSVSSGDGENGMGEEPSIQLHISYKSLYRMKGGGTCVFGSAGIT